MNKNVVVETIHTHWFFFQVTYDIFITTGLLFTTIRIIIFPDIIKINFIILLYFKRWLSTNVQIPVNIYISYLN